MKMEERTVSEKLINGVDEIERNLEISQINTLIKELEDKRDHLYTKHQENNDVKPTKEILRQQLQLLAECSKSCPHENMLSLTTAMLDIAIYLSSN